MYHGVVNVYKEKGYTSFDVIALARGVFGQRKIGHTGTLDPQAEGVLPVCLGSASKLCGMLTDTDKTYRAVMLLGVETDTQDMTGTVTREKSAALVTDGDIRRALKAFTGEIDQIPPMYSAKKVGGKRLYDLAREGITVERKPSRVTIYDINIERIELPHVTMTVRCSKGTYIRTLCHDIGQELGCGAAMESLVRTRAAGLDISDALSLDRLQSMKEEGSLADALIPVDSFFKDCKAARVKSGASKLLLNGNPIKEEDVYINNAEDAARQENKTESGRRADVRAQSVPGNTDLFAAPERNFRMYDAEGKFRAIYKYDIGRRTLYPVKMFLED